MVYPKLEAQRPQVQQIAPSIKPTAIEQVQGQDKGKKKLLNDQTKKLKNTYSETIKAKLLIQQKLDSKANDPNGVKPYPIHVK